MNSWIPISTSAWYVNSFHSSIQCHGKGDASVRDFIVDWCSFKRVCLYTFFLLFFSIRFFLILVYTPSSCPKFVITIVLRSHSEQSSETIDLPKILSIVNVIVNQLADKRYSRDCDESVVSDFSDDRLSAVSLKILYTLEMPFLFSKLPGIMSLSNSYKCVKFPYDYCIPEVDSRQWKKTELSWTFAKAELLKGIAKTFD